VWRCSRSSRCFISSSWSLGRVAGAYFGEGVLVTVSPAVSTVGWIVLLAVFAAWRLERADY
jgi:hypothetical protein